MTIVTPAVDIDCTCYLTDACDRHASLTALEREAVEVLYRDVTDVGNEGGGFYGGQAEEVVAVLRRAGFLLVRA